MSSIDGVRSRSKGNILFTLGGRTTDSCVSSGRIRKALVVDWWEYVPIQLSITCSCDPLRVEMSRV